MLDKSRCLITSDSDDIHDDTNEHGHTNNKFCYARKICVGSPEPGLKLALLCVLM